MSLDIYARVPVNKTASLVVTQSNGVEEDPNLLERENLLAKVSSLQKQIKTLPKGGDKRKQIGKEIEQCNLRIGELKNIGIGYKQKDIQRIIVDIIKESMTAFEWERLTSQARERLHSETENNEGKK